MKILIADDHAVVRHGLKQILADEFKKSVFGEAGNAQEALELVWKEPWDVVVLDITMPGRSGLEVLRRIRTNERSRSVSVVILTASRSDQDYKESMKLGVTAYITKPVDFLEFSTVMPKIGFRWQLVEQM